MLNLIIEYQDILIALGVVMVVMTLIIEAIDYFTKDDDDDGDF